MKIQQHYLLVFFLSLFSSLGIAQNIGGGLVIGFNASQVDGDQLAGYHKLGLNLGIMGVIPINKKAALSLEILFNQKGSVKNPHPKDPSGSSYKLRMDYLDVAGLFNFKDKEKAIFSTGFSYGTMVRFYESVNSIENPYPSGTNPYSSLDLNWLADIKYQLLSGLYINYRFAYSILGIRKYIDYMGRIRNQHHHYMSFRLVYLLNQ